MLAAATDLKLVDSQEVRLLDLDTRFHRRNRSLHARLDSLRPPGEGVKPIDSVTAKREAIDSVVEAIHDNRTQIRADALATMTHGQQKTYAHIESKVKDAIRSDALDQSPSGGGGGPPSSDSSR
jgi:hypothetical protein